MALALEAPVPVSMRSPALMGRLICMGTTVGRRSLAVNAVICILLCNVREEKEPPVVAHGGTLSSINPPPLPAWLERMNN